MGDINQIIYGRKHLPKGGRVLEVGSKDYGSTSSFRDVLDADEYVGLDVEYGPNVDVVFDLELGTAGQRPFDTVICCSVLEHTPRPWIMAINISELVKPGGFLYISVPWVQRYHPYPDDYYRFSPRGVEQIFPDFKWPNQCFSTTKKNEFVDFKKGADNKMNLMVDDRKYLPYLFTNMIGVKNG